MTETNKTAPRRRPRPDLSVCPADPDAAALWQMWQTSGLSAPALSARMAGYLGAFRRDPSSVYALIRRGTTKSTVQRAFARAANADPVEVGRHAEALAARSALDRKKQTKNNSVL